MKIQNTSVLPSYQSNYTILSNEDFQPSPKLHANTKSFLLKNECVWNSYQAAKDKGDTVVEGIIFIAVDGIIIDGFGHAWNKSKDGKYYDVTKDYIWNTPEFSQRRKKSELGDKEPTYLYFACNEFSPPQMETVDEKGHRLVEFYYDYSKLKETLLKTFSLSFSVLLSIYRNNTPAELKKAIESIYQDQILRPSEIIAVIDGPIPEELEDTINDLCKDIPVLKTLPLEKNVGLGEALNIGMQNVSNELVARMDTDDISLPDRFVKQIEFMVAHPDIAVCGGQISEFIDNPDNIVGYRKVPLDPNDCRKYFQDRDPLNHMTVMLRKSAVMIVGNYLPWHLDEDTYLWGRILKEGFKIANITDILVNVRVGKDMYARRGGWKYFKSDVKILKWKLDNGLTGRGRYCYNYLVRFAVQVCMPNKLRGWVFNNLLRQH